MDPAPALVLSPNLTWFRLARGSRSHAKGKLGKISNIVGIDALQLFAHVLAGWRRAHF